MRKGTLGAMAAMCALAACGEGTSCPPGSMLAPDGRCIATEDAGTDGGELPDAGMSDAGVEPEEDAAPPDGSPELDAGEVDGAIPCTLVFFVDADADGVGAGPEVIACAAPAGHSAIAGDCDDTDPQIAPGAAEICDGVDQDCDGEIDEELPTRTLYRDADGDGYGTAESTIACGAPPGYADATGDCDDASATIHPGAVETCNGVDEDCDAMVDEGLLITFYEDADADGYGNPMRTRLACTMPSGWVLDDRDCDDGCATCNPAIATEARCDGRDDDCDGAIDDGLQTVFYVDCDRDGYAPVGVAPSPPMCAAPAAPPSSCGSGGWTARAPGPAAVDCADGDSRAFPTQTMYFSTPIAGAPAGRRYDFDCDGSESRQYSGAGSCVSMGAGSCVRTTGWTDGTDPACGVSESFVTGCSGVCFPTTVTRAQACR